MRPAILASRPDRHGHYLSRHSQDGLSWVPFFTPHPAPEGYQVAHRGCVFPATSPCCLLHKPKFKAQSDLYPVAHSSCLLHPSLPISTTLPLHHVPGSLQLLGDSAAGGLQTDKPRWAEEAQEGREVPTDGINPVLAVHHQGKTRQGRHGPVPQRCSTNAYCGWRPGMSGVGPLQTPNPRLVMRTLNRGFQTTKTAGS